MSAASSPFPLFTLNTWSATPTAKSVVLRGLPRSVERLAALLEENGEDDYGQIGPTQLAFRNALHLVLAASSILGYDVCSSPVVDSQGGVRVTWRRGDKILKLVCPATRDAAIYLYQSSPAGDSLRDQNVTPSVLAERIAWLVNRDIAAAG